MPHGNEAVFPVINDGEETKVFSARFFVFVLFCFLALGLVLSFVLDSTSTVSSIRLEVLGPCRKVNWK